MPDEVLAGSALEAVKVFERNDQCISSRQSEGFKILKPGRARWSKEIHLSNRIVKLPSYLGIGSDIFL